MSPSLPGTTALGNYIPLNEIPFAPAVGWDVSPPLNCSVLPLCSTEQLLMFYPRGVCSSLMGEMIKASKALDHLEWKVLHKHTPLVLLMLSKANFSCCWSCSSLAFNDVFPLWDMAGKHSTRAVWWMHSSAFPKEACFPDRWSGPSYCRGCHEMSAMLVEFWRRVNLGPLLWRRKVMTLGNADTYPGIRRVENLAWDQSTNKNDGAVEKTGLFRQFRLSSLSTLEGWLIQRGLLTCLQSTEYCVALAQSGI